MNETNQELLALFIKYSDLLKHLEKVTLTGGGDPIYKNCIGLHVTDLIKDFEDFKKKEVEKAVLELQKDPGYHATQTLIDFYRNLWMKARELEYEAKIPK